MTEPVASTEPIASTNPVASVVEPPRGILPTLGALGPGIIVAGSVIGGGELINAPIQAATFGFVLLWAALLACVLKYFLQVEIGRYAILHNATTFEALNLCPGPKIAGISWISWIYMVGYTVTQVGLVGILLAIAGLLSAMFPLGPFAEYSVTIWGILVYGLTQFLLWRSRYAGLEKIVMVLVALFSLAVIFALVLIQGTSYRIAMSDIVSGLQFSFGHQPALATVAVISMIGALGTTANELFQYPYWLLEKGFSNHIGPPGAQNRVSRAQGWIRVLRIDVGVSTLIATFITAAFFLLGAAVFFGRADVPKGIGVVNEISTIFTVTYGHGSHLLFGVGAVATLFSTLLISSAASGRMGADLLGTMGVLERSDATAVHCWQQRFHTFYLGCVFVVFLLLKGNQPPAVIVIFAQFVSGLFLTPLLMFSVGWLAFHTEKPLRMSWLSGACLVVSIVVVCGCIVAALAARFG